MSLYKINFKETFEDEFNMEKFMEDCECNDCVRDIDFTILLSNSKKVVRLDESVISYKGKSILKFISIYEYKQYYFFFYIEKEGYDINIIDVCFKDFDRGIDYDEIFDSVTVYSKVGFDIISVADKLDHLDPIMELFSKLGNVTQLCGYIKRKFRKYE